MPDKAIVRLKSVASKLEDLARSLEGIEDHVSAPDFPPSERPDVGLINFRESILALAAEAEQFAEDYVFGDDPEHRLDHSSEQQDAERIVNDAEHLYDIATTGDAEGLEEAFRSYVDGVRPWPGITLDPDHIDYAALTEHFRIKD